MTSPAATFQDLVVWQRAHQFVLNVYHLTQAFPKSETYGLISQMRRAGVSIAANIAEGFKKHGDADKLRLFNIAQGSIEESKYYLILVKELNYADTGNAMTLLEEVSKLLQAYCHSIRIRISKP